MNHTINLKTNRRIESIDITSKINEIISKSELSSGVFLVYSPHTTSGIIINESYDPSVIEDINVFLSKIVPYNNHYTHLEGNSDAHIKSSIIGSSKILIFENRELSWNMARSIFYGI